MIWNTTLKERLVALRHIGLQFSEIGRTLGLSKNACVGQANRLGPCHAPVAEEVRRESFFPMGNYPYVAKTCRYPLWGDDEAPTFEFCDAQRQPGRPYCAHHDHLCHMHEAEKVAA